MAKFTYRGETADGKPVHETVEAIDRYAVYSIARTNGHIVTGIEETSRFSFKKFINIERINYSLSRVKMDELVMITRNLGSMLDAGLALSRALSVIERQSKNPKLKGIMKDIRDRISQGDQFNDALRAYPKTFSPLYVAMVRAGEESGGLSSSLRTIGVQLERSSNLRKKIKGAMIYPAIVISVMCILGILMMVYVMPTLTATFTKLGTDLPITTRALIGISNFLTQNGLLALMMFIGTVTALVTFVRTAIGRKITHFIIVRLPVIGVMVKETNSAYTARTLSSLLSSGVDVIGAIHITKEVLQNVYFRRVLDDAAKRVEKGNPLSQAFIDREDLYPILVGEMISVGEETGQISQMLTEVANFYESEVERKTKDLSTIIEPLLMVVIGAGVGFFALAMIAPIYSISDSI